MKYINHILSLFFCTLLISCSDFLEPEDSRYINSDDLANALNLNPTALIQGVYSRMIEYGFYMKSGEDDFGQKSIDICVDIWGEDIVHYTNSLGFTNAYHMEERVATSRRPARQWQYCYANIRDVNNILGALPEENEANFTDDQLRLRGEALALRAYHYFLLVNLFQTAGEWEHIKDLPGVPVYTESSMEGGVRGTVSDVYKLILSDYEKAIRLLAGFTQSKPTRLSQIAAKGLAARANLYAGEYQRALELAGEVIAESTLMSTADYTSGFSDINNVEWIWGAEMTSETTGFYASFFSIMDPLSPGYAGLLGDYKTIDRRLYDNILEGDIRKQCFGDASEEVPYQQYKFVDPSKVFTGDVVFLRVADAYYIQAEAAVRRNNIPLAQQTLDRISNARAESGIHPYIWSDDASELLDQIFIHKRIELWGEGQGIFEFNRLEKPVDRTYEGSNHPVGNIISGGDHIVAWKDPLRTLQIPVGEFEGNPNLTQADQNP